MKLLTPHDVAERTSLPYVKALLLVKSLAYIRIGKCYYVSEATLDAALTADNAIEITECKEQEVTL